MFIFWSCRPLEPLEKQDRQKPKEEDLAYDIRPHLRPTVDILVSFVWFVNVNECMWRVQLQKWPNPFQFFLI